MTPRNAASTLVFHDAVVCGIEHDVARGELIMRLQLCNYMQPGHNDGDPELIDGRLVFSSLRRLDAEPELSKLVWSDQFSGQVLHVEPIDDSQAGASGLKFVIETTDYRTRSQDILVAHVFCEDVEWLPC